MKTIAGIWNIFACLATCFVLLTDGVPTSWIYVLLAMALILVPVLTAVALVREAAKRGGSVFEKVAGMANLALLAFVGYALVDQYPHPLQTGFLIYVALIVLAPIISAVLLLRSARSRPEATV